MTSDGRFFRNILGCYSTGIAIISTTGSDGNKVAVTVNSFSSVSLSPPLILFSLSNKANVLSHFRAARNFSVSILGSHQRSIANIFARPSTARWDQVKFREGANGSPLMENALAYIECVPFSTVDVGDHMIFIGEVTNCELGKLGEPLIFYKGEYGVFLKDDQGPSASIADFSFECDVAGWG
ncbi:MAG: flavin reductase family protein [Burkholderiales bacterium]|nr:flavin reductase family protein [Burkholderiales bacterium]